MIAVRKAYAYLKHHYPSLLSMLGLIIIAVLMIVLPFILSTPLSEEQDGLYPSYPFVRYGD